MSVQTHLQIPATVVGRPRWRRRRVGAESSFFRPFWFLAYFSLPVLFLTFKFQDELPTVLDLERQQSGKGILPLIWILIWFEIGSIPFALLSSLELGSGCCVAG